MTTATQELDGYITISDAAQYAGVSDKTIRRWIAKKKLPQYRAGNRIVRVRLKEVDEVFTSSFSW
ncbi:helix-turn-helix transcriptional regulator [Corynebacterium resistens]